MSLIIAVTNPEGIVVAGDSRQTFLRRGSGGVSTNRVGSDSGVKVFDLTAEVVAATTGWAFLRPQGAATLRNISSLVDDFKRTIQLNAPIATVAADLHTHFTTIYQWHVGQNYDSAPPAGRIALSFLVVGYDQGARTGLVFLCEIPGTVRRFGDTDHPNPFWFGQTDVVARIMLGYDPRLVNLATIQSLQANPQANLQQQLGSLNYVVGWPTMTLQDAIDFAASMIQTTITIQRFAEGIVSDPSGPPGVGGPIDIAVCRPGKPICWIARKDLHA